MTKVQCRSKHGGQRIDQNDRITQKKSLFGAFADLNVLVWMKGLALDPCSKSSKASIHKFRSQILWLRTFLRFCDAKCPPRKRKLQHLPNESEHAAASQLASEKFTDEDVKQLGADHFSLLSNSTETSECSDMQTALTSCSSEITWTSDSSFEANLFYPHLSILDNAANWDPFNHDSSPLTDTDESVDDSKRFSPENLVVEDATTLNHDDLVHGSDPWSSKEKSEEADWFWNDEHCANPVVSIDPSFQAEVPKHTGPAKANYSDYSLVAQPQQSDRFLNVDYCTRPFIPIGPGFQAELTECIKPAKYRDDPENLKWLGTKIWPREGRGAETVAGVIGQGRPESPSCLPRGCIKRYVHEAHLRLQSELGPAFYSWKFDEMGEVVSESRTLRATKRIRISYGK